MLIKRPAAIPTSEITDYAVYQQRRTFLKTLGGLALLGANGLPLVEASDTDTLTSYKDITTYNNFIELADDKDTPATLGERIKTRPWTLTIEGECEKPATLDLDAILKQYPVQERIYRFRCVEGWSMVIPWQGFALGAFLKQFSPTANAKFVLFESLHDATQLPAQAQSGFDWPYREGLRMDEAMHPLTLLATGLYGKSLLGQNGAPLRLVVPWKYGFKSSKTIVKIKFVEKMPVSTWMARAPDEYGFYANVNPEVDHPRWSQRKERRIGEFQKRETLLFNGYATEVASLYSGMDLTKQF